MIDNPLRRLLHNPKKMFYPHVRLGDVVLDVGCGPATFTVDLAKMVGESGKVVAFDIQEEMIGLAARKVEKHDLSQSVTFVKDIEGILSNMPYGFINMFYVLHEVDDQQKLMDTLYESMRPDGILLIVEPSFHVSSGEFLKELELAKDAGFKVVGKTRILLSRARVLTK